MLLVSKPKKQKGACMKKDKEETVRAQVYETLENLSNEGYIMIASYGQLGIAGDGGLGGR